MVSEEILKRYERDYLVVSREVVGDALQDLEHMQQEASAVALILAGYGGLDAEGSPSLHGRGGCTREPSGR